MSKRIIGYGVCGREADRYLRATLECFKKLCDETIILGNNVTEAEHEMIAEFGFHLVEDDREWGRNQHLIKQDFVRNHVAKLNPDVTICLDMDEVLLAERDEIEAQFEKGDAFYVYIVNLWNEGWRQDWSFSNVRMWSWRPKEELGEGFWRFEQRPLHCGLAPKWTYALNLTAPFVLEHYGLKKKADRERKIARYEEYDPNRVYRAPEYYEALRIDSAEPYDRKKVQEWVKSEVEAIPQPLNKKMPVKKETKRVLVVREADGLTFDVDEKQAVHYLRQKYKGKGFKVIDDAPKAQRKSAKPKGKTLVYSANHNQKDCDDTEGHISRAFEELGWNVIKITPEEEPPEGDVLLYHKTIPPEFTGVKVCWYFDKIDFNERKEVAQQIYDKSDFFFATDGDASIPVITLRQGVGYDCRGGREIEAPDVAFTGSLYGDRQKWWDDIKEKYNAQQFSDKHGRELNDLCVSTKILLAPQYPSSDNYWSNRVYNTIGRGGFMLHPYCKGLTQELTDGTHIVYYHSEEDMHEKIKYYLKHDEERETIRIAGRDLVRSQFTYKDRVKELCSHLTKEN